MRITKTVLVIYKDHKDLRRIENTYFMMKTDPENPIKKRYVGGHLYTVHSGPVRFVFHPPMRERIEGYCVENVWLSDKIYDAEIEDVCKQQSTSFDRGEVTRI